MCQYVFALYASYSVLGLRSVMTTALDIDERLHSEVSLKQEQGNVRTREDVEERGERLQRRTPRKRQLSAIESPDGRLERLQRRRQREGQTEICQRYTVSLFSALSKEKLVHDQSEDVRLDAISRVQYLPSTKVLW